MWRVMMNFKKLVLKILCYFFDDIIKIEDFDFDILIDAKLSENIFVYNISYNTLIGDKPL